MALMTMTTPLGNKVRTRAHRRYAVVTDVRDIHAPFEVQGKCMLRTDDYQNAVRYVCKHRPRAHHYNTFFIYDTILKVRVARG